MMRSEFEFIHHIKERFSLTSVGDDCAVLPKDAGNDMAVTADLLIEDIDFHLEWTTPEFLGHKALTVSLSDIGAMGARAKWSLLSIGVPDKVWDSNFIDRFYEGWHSLAKRERVELVGGDISRTPDKIVVDSIVGGEVPKGRAILRSGAKAGDAIVVTGFVGGSAGGLKLLQNGRRLKNDIRSWEETLIHSHLQPWPQTETGVFLQKNRLATAMIDISDGLGSDLEHICRASNVGATLFAEKIPLNLNLAEITRSFDEQLEFGLNGGEDYELLFTVDPERVSEFSSILIDGDDNGLFTVIGEITSNVGVIELIRDGISSPFEPNGYKHF